MSECGGLMKPVELKYKSGKGFQIIHKCLRCGHESTNKVAEDTVQPDDIEVLAGLSEPCSVSGFEARKDTAPLTRRRSWGTKPWRSLLKLWRVERRWVN